MRIALFVSVFPNLSETFVVDHAVALIEAGHDVRIYAERAGDTHVVHHDVRRLSLIERTVYFQDIGNGAWSRRMGTAFSMMRLRRSISPQYHSRSYTIANAARALTRKKPTTQHRFDAVLCHFGPNGVTAAALRELGLIHGPVATVFHAYELSRDRSMAMVDAYKKLAATTQLILPCTRYWQRMLIDEMGIDARRVAVQRMGVRVGDQMPPRPPFRSPLRVTIVARLEPKKGHDTLLDAVRLLPPGSIELSIVGGGSIEGTIRDTIAAWPAPYRKSVRMLGPCTPDSVQEILQHNTDVFCLPSVVAPDGDMEGLPVSIMEAMAQGIPVIATRHSGIPELVIDRVTGLLVPERDPNALANALIECTQQPDAARQRAEHAFTAVQRGFNAEVWNAVLVDRCDALCRGDFDAAAREPECLERSSWGL